MQHLRTAIHENVVVGPTEAVLRKPSDSLFRGGPRFDQFEDQDFSRHCRGKIATPMDDPPRDTDRSTQILSRAIWVGPAVNHFGHMIADFGMRIAPSAHSHPDWPLLFSVSKDRSKHDLKVPKALISVLGVDQSRVMFVDRPLTVSELRVIEQPERLFGAETSRSHIEYMDDLYPRRPEQSIDLLYVSRSRFLMGSIAGEAAIERAMTRAGAVVIYPEELPLSDQIEYLQRSRTIVFAEGSAVHTLQLRGVLKASVVVLNRRNGAKIARMAVRPRARRLTYVDAVSELLTGLTRAGGKQGSKGISVLDEHLLLEEIRPHVPKLLDHWDREDFKTATLCDLSRWVKKRLEKPNHPSEPPLIKCIARRLLCLVSGGLPALEFGLWMERPMMVLSSM